MPINNANHAQAAILTCAECGSSSVATSWRPELVPYGDGPDSVQLSCSVPVRSCRNCSAEFSDSEADDIRHETICNESTEELWLNESKIF
jgi:hypothetical protein